MWDIFGRTSSGGGGGVMAVKTMKIDTAHCSIRIVYYANVLI